ncbi:MAG: hypothetical protein ABEH59_06500 [Halobacteriales archaeon]
MAEELQQVLREVRDTLLENPVSPRVETPAEINLHYCQYVADTVAEQVSRDVEILEDGGKGYAHTWLRHNGRHYDAECIHGVDDYRDLPFFHRHPEAALRVEPGTASAAAVRKRGRGPLYPEIFSRDSPETGPSLGKTDYWMQAVAGVIFGGLLLLIGLLGEWAIHEQLLSQSATLQVFFYDLEIIGELIAVLSPIIFFVLVPATELRPQG